ncbi:MAG: hypothetical protein ACE5HH_01725 [Candidatus Hydrothermarchaeales archaeon]
MPSAVAKYAGSHTWELNDTGGAAGLQCGKCHTYIVNEINYSGAVGDVAFVHRNASNYSGYVGSNQLINITYTPSGSLYDVCWMCHVQELDATVTGGHTKVVIRACTDGDCHGDQTNSGSCTLWTDDNRCNVTGNINSSTDAHYNFYRPLTAFNSTIGNEDGGVYDRGYIACLGCHTHVGLDLNLTRPNKLSLTMVLLSTGEWNATSLTVNYSSTNVSVEGKEPGSVW